MVTNMAMNMGADIMKQKQKEVEGMVEKYISVGQLKVSVLTFKYFQDLLFKSLIHISVLFCCRQHVRYQETDAFTVSIHTQ